MTLPFPPLLLHFFLLNVHIQPTTTTTAQAPKKGKLSTRLPTKFHEAEQVNLNEDDESESEGPVFDEHAYPEYHSRKARVIRKKKALKEEHKDRI